MKRQRSPRAGRWQESILQIPASLEDGMISLSRTGLRIVLVLDENYRILGTVVDGDIRRSLIQGEAPKDSIMSAVNTNFKFTNQLISQDLALEIMSESGLLHLPILDGEGKPVGIYFLEDLLGKETLENLFVVMAGGQGIRLRPLTNNTPKPMLRVDGRPIVERLLETAQNQGFKRALLCVNYLADQIQDYFGDGVNSQLKIEYLVEQAPLGTAGAILNVRSQESLPFIVTNGDVISDLDYIKLLRFHNENKATITVAVKKYEITNPFGVIEINKENKIVSLQEKPKIMSSVNAGIYVVDPDCLKGYDLNKKLDMTDIIRDVISNGGNVFAFQGDYFWYDIGTLEDLSKVNLQSTKLGKT